MLRFASDKLWGDTAFVDAAVAANGRALEFSPSPDAVGRSRTLEIVRRNGLHLEFCAAALRDDKEVVTAAVAANGDALRFASAGLRDDPDVVLLALRTSPLALQFASPRLRGSRPIVEAAVALCGHSLTLASTELQRDTSMVIQAILSPRSPIRLAELRGCPETLGNWHVFLSSVSSMPECLVRHRPLPEHLDGYIPLTEVPRFQADLETLQELYQALWALPLARLLPRSHRSAVDLKRIVASFLGAPSTALYQRIEVVLDVVKSAAQGKKRKQADDDRMEM